MMYFRMDTFIWGVSVCMMDDDVFLGLFCIVIRYSFGYLYYICRIYPMITM